MGGLLSAFGYAYEATVVALFPTLFIPVMVGTWLAQGKAVPFGAIGPLTIGSLCTPFYRSVSRAHSCVGIVYFQSAPSTLGWPVSSTLVQLPSTCSCAYPPLCSCRSCSGTLLASITCLMQLLRGRICHRCSLLVFACKRMAEGE